MADTLAHLKRDRSFWKRLLRFAGYYHGKIDWLNTKEFRFSQAKWKNETEGLRRHTCPKDLGHVWGSPEPSKKDCHEKNHVIYMVSLGCKVSSRKFIYNE